MDPTLTSARAIDALRSVYDPELGLDIVNLGLVRNVEIDSREVRVTMTMTTPACPMSAMIKRDVEAALEPLAGGCTISVDIVFQPPWKPEDMTDEGRRILGLE